MSRSMNDRVSWMVLNAPKKLELSESVPAQLTAIDASMIDDVETPAVASAVYSQEQSES